MLSGKTNLDQFATGLVGTRSPYGAPRCVFNRAYVSGGSSSGSAVAVAAGLVAFALGTDTAGSGRVPAAFNGLIGFKPTKGRWSTQGLVPACRSLDCITRPRRRLRPTRPWSTRSLPASTPTDPVFAAVRRRRRMLGRGAFASACRGPTSCSSSAMRQLQRLYEQALSRWRPSVARAVEIDIAPLLEAAQLLYGGPWVAERTAAIEELLRSNPARDPPGRARHRRRRRRHQRRRGLSRPLRLQALDAAGRGAVGSQIDVLVLPTAPTIYRVGELLAEPVALNSNLGLYTNFVNLLDMAPSRFRPASATTTPASASP